MEYWIFNKSEMRFIADLMIDKLLSLPNNVEVSVMDLFEQALDAEYVEGVDKDGDNVHGYKISDILLENGKYLHDRIRWDFENGIWLSDVKQGLALYKIFDVKAKMAGYIIDGSTHACGHVGLPYSVHHIYRKKKFLLLSFGSPDKSLLVNNEDASYSLLTKYEVKQYQYQERPSRKTKKYEIKRALQLMRVPVGCSTGKIYHKKGNICVYVLKGKCSYTDFYWDYCAIYPKRKAKWNENSNRCDLRFNQSTCSRKNRYSGDLDAPSDAWYQLTNTGKSELVVFVADHSLSEYIEIE